MDRPFPPIASPLGDPAAPGAEARRTPATAGQASRALLAGASALFAVAGIAGALAGGGTVAATVLLAVLFFGAGVAATFALSGAGPAAGTPSVGGFGATAHEDAAWDSIDPGMPERDIVLVRDRAGLITECNPAFSRIVGQSGADLRGRRFADFLDEADGAEVSPPAGDPATEARDIWAEIRRRLLGFTLSEPHPAKPAVALTGDRRIRTPTGTRWFAFEEVAVVRHGRLRGWRAVGRDVTDRKAIEDALSVARDQAEAASAAKSRFLAMVSHEIRTPLNGILGMTGLLMQTQLSAEQRTYARAVETSGEALLLLIEDLLDFSKIEAGRLDLQPAPTPLTETIEELVELLAPRAFAKGIELAAYVDPRLPRMVMTDSIRLRQVLFNLAGNGIKFTNEGGVAIEVAPGPERGTVTFQVRDTGIGIAPADRERIFGEFEQADPGPARAYGGTGLGLAIARRLVRLMAGDILLDSSPGAGTCFSFTIPLRSPDEDIDAPAAAGAPAAVPDPQPVEPEGTLTGARAAQALLAARFGADPEPAGPAAPSPLPMGSALAGRRVLVVSHSLIEAPLVLRRLYDQGADVELITQREIEGRLGRAPRPDCVLYDAAACDPLEIADRIRAVAELPVGVLIDPRQRPLLPELQSSSVTAFLIKPIRAKSLLQVVRSLIERGDAGHEEPSTLEAPGDEAVQPLARRTVLICDDNEINLLLARGLAEKLGATTATALDGRRAVALVEDRWRQGDPIDLVLMDLHMPEMDGLEAARRIRLMSGEGRRMPRIVALTADLTSDARACCEAGLFDDWLGKPISPADFRRVLAETDPSGS